MSRHLVEELSGFGSVYAGDQLLRVTPYRVSVWSGGEASPGEPAADVNVEGHIDITGMAEAIVLAGAATLTLRLEDGRFLAFTLVGTDGRILGHGAPASDIQREPPDKARLREGSGEG